MRNVVDTITCDTCGKKKVTTYVHIGDDLVITKAGFLAANKPPDPMLDDNFYEIKPTQHTCGKCLKVVYAAMDSSFSRA